MTLPPNIFLLDKPVDMTSFRAIQLFKRNKGLKKVGHAGTLDPLASGLLIVAANEATKQIDNYLKMDKVYSARVRFGIATDTGDLEGKVTEQRDIPTGGLDRDKLESILAEMIGTFELPVPLYSAIKKDGKALYAYAREGKAVEVPIKPMKVTSVRLVELNGADAVIEWNVGSGTYIRSLAVELGNRLGYPATLAGLRRVSIGEFFVENAEKVN